MFSVLGKNLHEHCRVLRGITLVTDCKNRIEIYRAGHRVVSRLLSCNSSYNEISHFVETSRKIWKICRGYV